MKRYLIATASIAAYFGFMCGLLDLPWWLAGLLLLLILACAVLIVLIAGMVALFAFGRERDKRKLG